MENLTGKLVDRYQILELLGKGGMAMVYKAYDTRLEREVALKIIRLEAFPPEDLHDVRKRFEREAKALAQLSHPNIIKVMDYGEYEGSPFLVMEYLQGGTLKQMIGEPMSWKEAMRLLLPVARGLEYAHRRGIVHRDIKPANILLTENGEPMLSDFGIVKLFQGQETTTLTASGAAVGTPEYMAPEQWTGETGPKTDMYSLGVVLYETITGQRPYDADTPGGLFLKQVTEPLPQPRDIVPDLPESVERFLLKVLAKEPSERYDDFGALVRELEYSLQESSVEFKSGKPIKDPKVNADRNTSPLPRTNRRWVSVVVVAIVLIGLILGGIFGLPSILSRSENTPEPTLTLTEKVSQEPTQPVTATAELSPTSEANSTSEATVKPELGIGSTMTSDKDGMVMVYVPAGEFEMGSDADDAHADCLKFDSECRRYYFDNQEPIHTVYLNAFWIDQVEVTNFMYAKCVEAGRCNPPQEGWSAGRENYYGNPEFDNLPVVFVSWLDASSYCEWAERRLPTEAEWEKAASWDDDNQIKSMYPWGDGANCLFANINDCIGNTTAVGSYIADQSFYGAYDMAGNVIEWVADWYGSTYYAISPSSNPLGPTSGIHRVVRGGSFYGNNGSNVRTTKRGGREPSYVYFDSGFRCARDEPQKQVSTPILGPTNNDNDSASPTEITDDFGVEMALVHAGEFTMGSNRESNEQPVHTVYLDAFYIDKYEVTNAAYSSCVTTGVCEPPKTQGSPARNYYGDSQYDNYPVVHVVWNMASTYCEWRGASLPTEAQWEKAARGTDGFAYPWGEGIDCGLANFSGCVGDITQVGNYESGVSPYGVYDMAGNVWEWVNDWYSDTYYKSSPSSNPQGPASGEVRVVRGGSWYHNASFSRSSFRYRLVPTGIFFLNSHLGFRCARGVNP